MSKDQLPKFLTDPSPDMQIAWEQFNEAVGFLAIAHEIDAFQLSESVGRYTEEIVSVLRDGGGPGAGA